MFSAIIPGTTISIVFQPENQLFFSGLSAELLRNYGIYNFGSFNRSNKYLSPRERITFGEKSSRGSGGRGALNLITLFVRQRWEENIVFSYFSENHLNRLSENNF